MSKTFLAICLVLVLSRNVLAAEPKTTVTIRPEKTDEILANPGMGWEMFHRTSKQDNNLPSWIPSTVHYLRWGWKEVEPKPGKID